LPGGTSGRNSHCQQRKHLRWVVVLDPSQGNRPFDRLLDTLLIGRTKVEITGIGAPSLNRDASEPMLGGDVHHTLKVIDCHQGHAVGPIEHEKPFPVTRASS
jgi:hypothetical protein